MCKTPPPSLYFLFLFLNLSSTLSVCLVSSLSVTLITYAQYVLCTEHFLKKYGFESLKEFHAFAYTDYCIKKFIEAAKQSPHFNNTIFVFCLKTNLSEFYKIFREIRSNSFKCLKKFLHSSAESSPHPIPPVPAHPAGLFVGLQGGLVRLCLMITTKS